MRCNLKLSDMLERWDRDAVSGCHVRLRGRRGFTRQPENSKRAHLCERPGLQKHRSWPAKPTLANRVWPNRLWPALVFLWYGRLWPKPTLAKTDFGQNRLWPNQLWPNRVRLVLCVCVCAVWRGVGYTDSWCGVSRVGVGFKVWFGHVQCPQDRPSGDRPSQEGALPRRAPFPGGRPSQEGALPRRAPFPGGRPSQEGALPRRAPFPWTAQIFALFSLYRRKIRSFSLSGGLLVEFWWCF